MLDRYMALMEERPELFRNSKDKEYLHIVTDPACILETEKVLGEEAGILYQDSYIMLLKDVVCYPDGSYGMYIRIVYTEKNPGIVVIPFRGKEILFLRHFRHGNRKEYLELPRGFGEKGTGKENVEREMLEETGYRVNGIQRIGTTAQDTGLIAGEILVYRAEIDSKAQGYDKDCKESICGIEWMDTEQIRRAVRKGYLTDGITLSALMILWAADIT